MNDISKDIINLILDKCDPSTRRVLGGINKKWNWQYKIRFQGKGFKPPQAFNFKLWYDFVYDRIGSEVNTLVIDIFLRRKLTPKEEWEFVQLLIKHPTNPLFKCLLETLPKEKQCVLRTCGHCHGLRGLNGIFYGNYHNIE